MEAPEKWQFPYFTDDFTEFTKEQILASDISLLGRVTYETFADFWPTQTNNEFGIADKLNSMPKVVVSSTLAKAGWNNSTQIKGNAMEEIVKLKQQGDGIIATTGSAMLVQALMRADLVDEYQLTIHPIILGSGKRLFEEGINNIGLKLIEAKPFKGGIVALIYQPDRKK
jgi:dihydrofolate reductase